MIRMSKRAEFIALKRERTRARLLEVAVRVIADRGFDAPTIDHFIAAAGVARGTFYSYFKTREDILRAAAAHIEDAVDAEILPLFEGIEDPAQRIAIAISKFIDMSRRRPDWGGLLVRMIPLAGGPVSAEMRRGVLYDLKVGLKSGRFHFPSMQAAVALSMGTITLAIRATIKESTPSSFSVMIATMILQGLGMSPLEAARIAARSVAATVEVTKTSKPRAL
jgi:AcrR family transcriptional regulator